MGHAGQWVPAFDSVDLRPVMVGEEDAVVESHGPRCAGAQLLLEVQHADTGYAPLRFPRALAPALARQPQPLSVSAMRNHITYVWTYELCTPLHAVLIFLNNPTLSARCNPPLPTRLNRTLLD